MKIKHLLLLLIIVSSCKDDISNRNFRNENYVFYQENGKPSEWLKINPELEIDLPKSHSTYFFPNGSKFAELKVIDSFPNRVLKYFNLEDKLIRIVEFKSDSIVNEVFENGHYKEYHSNFGLMKSEGLIENNLPQGKWKFYRKDGKTIKQTLEYINDTLHGVREDYWENGNLKSKVTYQNGKQNGKSFHYYETGELEEENYLKDRIFHGPMKSYYKNGNVKNERNYWNGKEIDTFKTFFKNGNIELLRIINLDTLTMEVTGKQYTYYERGKPKGVINIENYKANGSFIMYNEDGILLERSEKRNNKHHGAFITYYDSGIKQLEGIAYKGFYDGKLRYYDKKGKLTKTVNYNKGIALDSTMN